MRDLTHEQASELLPAAALDVLPAEDQAAVLAHAAICAECGPTLAALRDATSQLAYAVPNVVDDPVRRARARTRLLARARADLAVADVSGAESGVPGGDVGRPDSVIQAVTTLRPPGERQSVGRQGKDSWLVSRTTAWTAAALTALAAAIMVMTLNSRAADDAREIALSRAADSSRIAQLEDTLSVQDSTIRELTGSQVSVLHLTAGTPRAAWAWMFWNRTTNRWTFFAHNLPAPPTGKTYQLWLVTPTAKISAGTFAPRPDGSAELQATYVLARDSLRAVAVTEEPAGGVSQPSGPFVITASAGQ